MWFLCHQWLFSVFLVELVFLLLTLMITHSCNWIWFICLLCRIVVFLFNTKLSITSLLHVLSIPHTSHMVQKLTKLFNIVLYLQFKGIYLSFLLVSPHQPCASFHVLLHCALNALLSSALLCLVSFSGLWNSMVVELNCEIHIAHIWK